MHTGTVVPVYRRARTLGWVSAALFATAGLLLLVGALLLAQGDVDGLLTTRSVDLALGDLTIRLPGGAVLLAAVLCSVALVLVVASVETARASRVLADKDRRSPGVPPAVAAGPSGGARPDLTTRPGGRFRITAVVPAHDEATTIGATIDSLRGQRRPPDEIVVVVDNSTDDTVGVASRRDVRVLVTRGNTGRKAGALNQALDVLLPATGPDDAVLVMDADTTLSPDFLEVAERHLLDGRHAVGGIFMGEPGAGLVGQLQRNEYVRYGRTIARRRGRRVMVLTGTGTLFRADALRAVAAARGDLVPGTRGQVYDPTALTEDNELTLALKTLDARLVSPRECQAVTEVMPTWRHLWRQRIRWDRGALENLGTYGLTSTTTRYWVQQVGLAYATVALNLYLVLVLVQWRATGELMFGLRFWTAITALFVVERLVTVWRVGVRGRLLALPLLVELAYSELILAVFVRGIVDIVTGRRAQWGHVDRASLARRSVLPVVLVGALWEPVVTEATLATPWFQTLGVVVGVNTAIFAFMAALNLVPRRQA
ncbi:glycosyltransferase [Cellulomonas septica]|uniref:Glycosyltransferase n=1 Tax=Cellulomonas septica TaxID=285080 RepID=A0ABX1K0L4_9CELL|nr:glycosyltransferase [Cellulomonas septica]